MKKLFLKLGIIWTVFFICYSLYAETPSKWVDGEIKFAYGEVGGNVTWSKKEQQDLMKQYTVSSASAGVIITITTYTLTSVENNTPKNKGRFGTYSDYKDYESKEKAKVE